MKKKWYHTNAGIILLLFLFFPLGMYYLWKHGTWKTNTRWKITGGFFLALFLLSFIYNLSPKAQQNRLEAERIKALYNTSANPSSSPAPKYSYEIVEKNDNGNVENYKVLIKSGDDDKSIAMTVKKECRKACNIDIFDDKQALELQNDYDAMMGTLNTKPQDLQTWKIKNYVFVADHLLGSVTFDTDGYQEYPYKDWYYKELLGEK